jgi:hypothetical protein
MSGKEGLDYFTGRLTHKADTLKTLLGIVSKLTEDGNVEGVKRVLPEAIAYAETLSLDANTLKDHVDTTNYCILKPIEVTAAMPEEEQKAEQEAVEEKKKS